MNKTRLRTRYCTTCGATVKTRNTKHVYCKSHKPPSYAVDGSRDPSPGQVSAMLDAMVEREILMPWEKNANTASSRAQGGAWKR